MEKNDKNLKEHRDRMFSDTIQVTNELKQINKWKDLQKLRKPRPMMSLYYILRSIFLSVAGVIIIEISLANHFVLIGVLISSILMMRNIRSFGNHIHEGMHNNLHFWDHKPTVFGKKNNRKIVNDMVTKYFLCPLTFTSYDVYVIEHRAHHQFLGHDVQDLEKVPRSSNKFLSSDSTLIRFVKLMSNQVFSLNTWSRSVFGDLPKMSVKELFRTTLVWLVLLVVTFIISPNAFYIFFSIWIFSRATSYHLLKVFCEFVDHYNLPEHGTIGYTRTMPRNILSFFIHPDQDNYHTAHHLFPNIPMSNLNKAHKILSLSKEYAKGNHFKSYRDVIISLTNTKIHD